MRAVILGQPGQVRIEEVPMPEPRRGEVRVRIEGCGLCASNLPLWEGRPWFSYPMEPGAPGHEAWGRIESIGKDVRGLREGDRVTMLSYRGFADYDVARADETAVLPETLEEKPLPGEPLGCAMNIFTRSQISRGQQVAVIGVGFLGALLVQMAVKAGARVYALSRRPSALQLAAELGAIPFSTMENDRAPLKEINRLTGERGCDVVIEATGRQRPLDLAGELTKVRGRMLIAGYHQDGLRNINLQLWNWKGIDVVNAHEREPARYMRGIRRAIRAVESGRINPFPLYTHPFALEEIDRAFETLHRRPEGFLKALVTT